jgi:hypothetical protein
MEHQQQAPESSEVQFQNKRRRKKHPSPRKAPPFKTHFVDMPIQIRSRVVCPPIYSPDGNYTLIQFDEHAEKVRCDACDTEDKAKKRVLIRDDATGQIYSSGLNCLEKYFGIYESELKGRVLAIRLLVGSWQKFVNKSTSKPVFYSSNVEALRSMADFLTDAASFECPALDEAASKLRVLAENIGAANNGGYKETIDCIQDLISLQDEHRHRPQLFEDRKVSLLTHPKLSPDERKFIEHFYTSLYSVTLRDIKRFSAILKELRQRNLTFKNPSFPPYSFESETKYLQTLQMHMEAVSAKVSKSHERYFHDEREGAISNEVREVRKNGYAVLSLADVDRMEMFTYELPDWLQKELREQDIYFHLSSKTEDFEESEVTPLQGGVDAMLKASQQDYDYKKSKKFDKPKNGSFRGFVMWRRDRWLDVYGLWHKYGGIPKARNLLERLAIGE